MQGYKVLAAVAVVALACPAPAEEPGLAAGLVFGAEQSLEAGGATDLTLDGFVEISRPSGAYGGLAFSKAIDGTVGDEADLYVGYAEDASHGLGWGVAYGLHLEDNDPDCCGEVELSLTGDGGTERTFSAQFSFGLNGDCCAAGIAFVAPSGPRGRVTSALSYDQADRTYSASIELAHDLSDRLQASVAAGRDGDDRSIYVDLGLNYTISDAHDIALSLRETDADAPSLSLSYALSLERGGN